MKVKMNNIFKKSSKNYNKDDKYYNKDIVKRRKNINNINNGNDELNYINEYAEENTVHRRRGATSNKNIFDILKVFTNKFAVKRNYYILFVLMIILASVSVYTNFITYQVTNSESYEVFNNSDQTNGKVHVESSTSEELQDLISNNSDTRKSAEIKNATVSTKKNVVVNTGITNTTSEEKTVKPLSFVKPINGEVIKVYSEDKLLFSKTLESWKTHDGVDIMAAFGESVKSVEKGIIERIYEDSFLGITIIIDHGQGYKSMYSNLDSNVNVKEKQVVSKSATIGKLGKTSIGEIKDESHIHFMLMLNNKVIDPTSKIKF